MIAADREIIRLYRAGSYRIYDREGFSFSLVAYTDKVEGLTIKGAKYEVEDCLLTNAFPLGISNVVKGFDGQDRKYAEISFKSGYLLTSNGVVVSMFLAHFFVILEIFLITRVRLPQKIAEQIAGRL